MGGGIDAPDHNNLTQAASCPHSGSLDSQPAAAPSPPSLRLSQWPSAPLPLLLHLPLLRLSRLRLLPPALPLLLAWPAPLPAPQPLLLRRRQPLLASP